MAINEEDVCCEMCALWKCVVEEEKKEEGGRESQWRWVLIELVRTGQEGFLYHNPLSF